MVGYIKYFVALGIIIFIFGSIEGSYSTEAPAPSAESKKNTSKFRKYAGRTAGVIAAAPGAAVGAAAGAVKGAGEGAVLLGRKGANVGRKCTTYVGAVGSNEPSRKKCTNNSPTRILAPSATAAGISSGAAIGAVGGGGYGALKGAKKAYSKTNKAILGKKAVHSEE